jgi:hypothetical protein
MESMVITGGEVDNAEEKGVSGSNAVSTGTPPTFHGSARSHFGRNLDRFEQAFGEVLGVYHRRVGSLAEACGGAMILLRSDTIAGDRVGGANQLGQAVLDAVDVSKLAVEHNLVIGVCEWNPFAGRGRRSLDTKERIQGVGNALDLLHLEVPDGTKVQDCTVCGANLKEPKGNNQSE